MDSAIKDLMQKNKIVGLQLAVIKDKVIFKTNHYALAAIEDSIAVDAQTVSSINSIVKAFTGVAIMQLAENGKLNLEEPISKYLDKLPTSWQKITVRQVIAHQSGLAEIWDSAGNILSENIETLFQKIKKMPLVFKPGEELRDNQANYLLLGMLIEKVSGQSFEKYIIENEFKKAGMKNSVKAGMGDFYTIIRHYARPYSYFRNNVLTNVYQPIPSNLYPAEGIYSTATEMAQRVLALQSHQLINPESLKTLYAPIVLNNGKIHQENGFLNKSSIGFSTTSRLQNPVIAALGGNRNALYIYPKDNLTVVILTNLVGSHPENFIEEIATFYLSEQK